MENTAITLKGIMVRYNTESKIGLLNPIFDSGNFQRLKEGLKPLQLASFLSSSRVYDLTELLKAEGVKRPFFKTGNGRNTVTHAHVSILLLAAETICPEFHHELHKKIYS